MKSAFSQTGDAQGDFYFIHPRESSDRAKVMWLLLAAAYGLVNENYKWQHLSDELFLLIGFEHTALLRQRFFIRRKRSIVVLAAKMVDDILLCGLYKQVPAVLDPLNHRFTLATVVHGAVPPRFSGLNLIQHPEKSVVVDWEDKLEVIRVESIIRFLRREVDSPINAVHRRSFASVDVPIGWLGITVSPT